MPSFKSSTRLSLLLVVCMLSLILSEFFLRYRYPIILHFPSKEVLAIQQHLTLHPKLGYLWKPNLPHEESIVLPWADTIQKPLCTDAIGFKNHPDAIRSLEVGRSLDILGVGDSFLQGAARPFYEFFEQHGLFYFSMANHRFSPPQYNVVLEDYALPQRPAWVVYGIFENDFSETRDFENWQQSGMDWFSFHSGTWCGAPQIASAPLRFLNDYMAGWSALLRRAAVGRRRIKEDPTHVLHYIREAHARTGEQAKFLVLLIPSKETVIGTSPNLSYLYDRLLEELGEGVPVLDLRPIFAREEDPSSLYYRQDNHWNQKGMLVAAEAILQFIRGS